MKLGFAVLRVIVGGLFMGHGLQKLIGAFGGHGLEGTAKGFESLGLRPGKANAVVAGAAETGGGALVAAGAATPLGATVLTATMATPLNGFTPSQNVTITAVIVAGPPQSWTATAIHSQSAKTCDNSTGAIVCT